MDSLIRIFFASFYLLLMGCADSKQKPPYTTHTELDAIAEATMEEFTFIEGEVECKCEHLVPPIGRINDFEGILSPIQEKELQLFILNYEEETTNQIAIITTNSINNCNSNKTFTELIGNCWGVGQKDKDNGLVIFMSDSLRSTHISTGTGTMKILTDSICRLALDSLMVPQYKEENYYQGTLAALKYLTSVWSAAE